MQRLPIFLLLGCLLGCASPVPNIAFVSKDARHWVAIESVPPAAGSDALLPTVRLRLLDHWGGQGLLLLEGFESLCGTTVLWQDDANLLLRVPEDRAAGLRIKDGQAWGPVTLHVQAHEDQVKMEAWSPDNLWRLVVISSCESENWNLYLRHSGDPTFNDAMKTGWDDPQLFGGFEANQPPLSLRFTGQRTAVIEVPGKSYGVTLRERVGEVTVHWKFIKHYKSPETHFETLKPIK